MPPISLMVKPASALCNMSCAYCFYHSLAQQRESYSYGMMTENTAEEVIKKALTYAGGAPMYLSFQGGEPLLRGKEFFRFVLATVGRNNTANSPVTLALQTNGQLIDDDWCRIFAEGDWLIGLSLDGDEVSNINRIDKEGKPVFHSTLAAAALLQKHSIPFNILSVVTEGSAKRIRSIYKFLTSRGFKHMQFIPCLKPLGGKPNGFCITKKTYGDYLISLFRLYLDDIRRGNYISVRQLDNFVLLANGRPAEQCGMNGKCGTQFVIEGDGTVFPCDFFCLDEYKLGNINNGKFSDFAVHPKMLQFVKESTKENDKCKKCKFFALCKGGCKRERSDVDKCEGYKKFFSYALPHLKNIR